ncbi:MAG: hypothetical protein CMC93_05435 [Flavobacteriaceae bacterium]|nr:hypothetical protein [Flavobacteriaceae bacterium]
MLITFIKMKKIRFTLVGDKCGKTSLVQRWCKPLESIKPSKTIAIDMRSMVFSLENHTVCVQYWDCSGDMSFQNLLTPYLKNAELIAVCFDLTQANSWLTAQYWTDVALENTEDTPICFIGTKLDKESKRIIKKTTVRRYIRSINARNTFYCETSAYTGENCKDTLSMCIFESLRTSIKYTSLTFDSEKEKSCILM